MPAWGERRGMTQLDNGVYFVAGESGSGIAVHNTVAEYVMSGHAHAESLWTGGNYRWFDLNSGAAIAMFELSSYRPKVLDLITSWESLMHTLAAEFPDYTDFWNRSAGTDCMIADMPAPSHMYLQWQLDQAMNQPALQLPGDKDEWEEQEDFYDPFDMPEI